MLATYELIGYAATIPTIIVQEFNVIHGVVKVLRDH
jgi:hypothetical protein